MVSYKSKLCELCGKEYNPTSPKQKYCIDCKDEGRKLADRKRDRKRSRVKNNYKKYTRVCPSCGMEFTTYYSKKIYCGDYGCDINDRGYTLLSDKYVNSKEKILLRCPEGHEWETTFHNFRDLSDSTGNRCMVCYSQNNYISRLEQKIRDFFECKLPDVEVIYNDRTQIGPKELDLYLPKYNLAIEVCGLYWHSDTANNIHRGYHYDKMISCKQKGIRLITLFEDEINKKFDLVASRILQAIGRVSNRIYARKCVVHEVPNKIASKFFDKNHLQGFCPARKIFGLYYNCELVAAMSVGNVTRNHANLGKTLELKRFCSISGTTIIGGASKLFKYVVSYAINNSYDNIKSYCDMRYANIFNPVYEILGFNLLSETKYTPHYFKSGVRYRNMSLRKTSKERLTGKTELELRLEQGYNRIWDCGHRTYLYTFN
jgi:hypothetical protein